MHDHNKYTAFSNFQRLSFLLYAAGQVISIPKLIQALPVNEFSCRTRINHLPSGFDNAADVVQDC